MKRILSAVVLLVMLLAIPAYAASARVIDVYPDLSFDGTEATCTVSIFGERTTDTISATMTLLRGSTVIDSWSASGSGILKMDETATVSRYRTYTLTVEYSINGVAQTPVSISQTNS